MLWRRDGNARSDANKPPLDSLAVILTCLVTFLLGHKLYRPARRQASIHARPRITGIDDRGDQNHRKDKNCGHGLLSCCHSHLFSSVVVLVFCLFVLVVNLIHRIYCTILLVRHSVVNHSVVITDTGVLWSTWKERTNTSLCFFTRERQSTGTSS